MMTATLKMIRVATFQRHCLSCPEMKKGYRTLGSMHPSCPLLPKAGSDRTFPNPLLPKAGWDWGRLSRSILLNRAMSMDHLESLLPKAGLAEAMLLHCRCSIWDME